MADDLPSIPKLREPVYPEVEDRKHLSEKQKAELCLKQNGKCAGCGKKPLHGWEFDHIQELWESGSNTLDNWQAFGSRRDCECHRIKTGEAAKRRAKMNRLRGKAGQRARREKNGPQIPSRPFMSMNPSGAANFGGLKRHPHLKRTFLGKVVPR